MINLNEIKKYPGWVNVNFQAPKDNRQTKYLLITLSRRTRETYLIDENSKQLEFEISEEKFPIVNFLIEFLA